MLCCEFLLDLPFLFLRWVRTEKGESDLFIRSILQLETTFKAEDLLPYHLLYLFLLYNLHLLIQPNPTNFSVI